MFVGRKLDMGNYVVGIGGSGIRVLRAIIHNCAAGIIDVEKINILAIDADSESIVWETLQQEYEAYNKMRDVMLIKNESSNLFHTKIELLNKKEILSPVEYEKNCRNLEMSLASNDELERIMKFFYTKEEREKDLKEGFFARPAIGCVFFSNFKDKIFNTFLEKVEYDIEQGKRTNVVLIGSIFGGTGASGIPTIIKLIEERIQNSTKRNVPHNAIEYLNMGAVFMLPYFKASNCSEENAMIKMQNFWNTSKEAMEYFFEEKYLVPNKYQGSRSLQRLHLVGKEELDIVNFYAEGGKKQENKPHIAEEYGALAVRDFFRETSKENFDDQLKIMYWKVEKEIDWESLYFEKDNAEKSVRNRMGELAQFAAIYHVCIYRYIKEKSDRMMNPQWYKTYLYKLKKMTDEKAEECLKDVNTYCVNYLRWIYYMQTTLSIEGEEKNYKYNEQMALFGEVLEDVYKLVNMEPKKEKKVAEITKNVMNNLEKIITVGSGMGGFLKKTVKILSALSTHGLFNGMGGIPQLIADLSEIIQ